MRRIGSSVSWTEVFSGYDICFGLQSGELYGWGGVGFQDGRPFGTPSSRVPVRIGSGSDWVTLSLGRNHALGLRGDIATPGYDLYGWGYNYDGQLGLPLYNESGSYLSNNDNIYTPRLLESGVQFSAIGAGNLFSTLLTADGELLASGKNDVGQLGIGITTTQSERSFRTNAVGQADLAAISVTVDEPVENIGSGATVSVTLEIGNVGSGSITEDFLLRLVCLASQFLTPWEASPRFPRRRLHLRGDRRCARWCCSSDST